jgi:hypothetical protein
MHCSVLLLRCVSACAGRWPLASSHDHVQNAAGEARGANPRKAAPIVSSTGCACQPQSAMRDGVHITSADPPAPKRRAWPGSAAAPSTARRKSRKATAERGPHAHRGCLPQPRAVVRVEEEGEPARWPGSREFLFLTYKNGGRRPTVCGRISPVLKLSLHARTGLGDCGPDAPDPSWTAATRR